MFADGTFPTMLAIIGTISAAHPFLLGESDSANVADCVESIRQTSAVCRDRRADSTSRIEISFRSKTKRTKGNELKLPRVRQ